MKKFFTILVILGISLSAFAQSNIPQLVSFSAVVRDANNQPLVNTAVSVRLTFKQGGQSGPLVYCALHQTTTNQNGFMSLQLNRNVLGTGCNGAPSTAFQNIPWENGGFWMEVEYQTAPATPFVSLGQLELASSFYAFAAGTAERLAGFDLSAANNGDVLTFNLSTGQWEASPPTGGVSIISTVNNGNGTYTFNYSNGTSFTTSNLTGPQGPAGATGPQGPAGNGLNNGTTTNQIMYWNGTAWVTLNPGSVGQILTMCANGLTWTSSGQCPGSIQSLNCSTANNVGTLTSGTAASGVSSTISYTGGNGGAHNGQTVSSTGVSGLTATLAAGNFANGTGTLIYIITGTPSTSGTASFALNIGGQSCTLNITVSVNSGSYPVGSVFCASGPTAVIDVINPTTGKTWMDRNLGASQAATSSTDAVAYGDMYQWGRRSDGHQCRNSATTSTLSSTDQPANGNFILAPNTPFDWRSPQNINLWQGVNGVNNPCPSGYRLPTDTELEAERLSWSVNTSVGAFASPLKLLMAGARNSINGSLFDVGSVGNYWSSTGSTTYSRCLSFTSSIANMNTNNRAYGLSVRCIKN
jgi:uncharacterized protein (TIGR02145 family)